MTTLLTLPRPRPFALAAALVSFATAVPHVSRADAFHCAVSDSCPARVSPDDSLAPPDATAPVAPAAADTGGGALATPTVEPAPRTSAFATPVSTALPPARFWNPGWHRVNAVDYTLTGVSLAGLAFEALVLQPKQPPLRWSEPILFDTQVRAALRTHDPQVAIVSSDVSWGLLGGLLAYPFLVDVPAAWARGNRHLAWELFWEDALTLSAASVIDLGIRDLTGRARPEYYDCLRAGSENCPGGEKTRSFPGGHFAVSTAAATLLCTQHLHTQLYGGAWDGLTCGTAVAADVTVGVLRMVIDQHWATDIIAGGILGSTVGYLVPTLMHYHGGNGRDGSGPSAMVVPVPMTFDHGAGLGVTGVVR